MIAKKGESVIYTGDTSYAVNDVTIKLMEENLIKDKEYIVDSYTGDSVYYKHHYVIYFANGNCGYFPIESFKLKDEKEIFKKRYNLK